MQSKIGKLFLWGLTIAILCGSLWALYATGFFQAAGSPEKLGAYISRCAPWSHLAYFGIQLASVVIAPIPSNITAAAGAYLFGLWPAFLLTWGRWRRAPPPCLPWPGCWGRNLPASSSAKSCPSATWT